MGRRKNGEISLLNKEVMGFDLQLLNAQIKLKKLTAERLAELTDVSRGMMYDFLKGRYYKKSEAYAKIKEWLLKNGFQNCSLNKGRIRELNKCTFAVHKLTKQVLTNPKLYARPTAAQKIEWRENAIMFNEKSVGA